MPLSVFERVSQGLADGAEAQLVAGLEILEQARKSDRRSTTCGADRLNVLYRSFECRVKPDVQRMCARYAVDTKLRARYSHMPIYRQRLKDERQ